MPLAWRVTCAMATLSVQRSGPSLAERVKALQRNAAAAVRAVGDMAMAALQETAPKDKMGPPYRLYDTLMTTTASTEYFYGIGPLSAMGSPEQPAPPHTIRDFLRWYRAEARRHGQERRLAREEGLAKQRAEKRLAREQKRAARVAELEARPPAKTGPRNPARDYKHLMQAERQRRYYRSAVVTVQRELADRYLAAPGDPSYGAVSVKMQFLARLRRLTQVPPTVFLPPPRVGSTVLRLERVGPEPGSGDVQSFFLFLDACFSARRKMLVNALGGGRRPYGTRDAVASALRELGLHPTARAEELSPRDLRELYRLLNPPAHVG